MIRVSNAACVRRLGRRSMKAARTRNIVAILAIALTALLFTSLFTIAMSFNAAFQDSNFRQVGGYSHGGFKYLSEEQFEELREDPLIREWGVRRVVGMVAAEPPFNKSHIEVGWSDANNAKWMWAEPTEGRLPQEGTNEAATDLKVLALLGIEPKLGAQFTLPVDVDGTVTEQRFTLCGWWEYDDAVVANHVIIPESRVDAIFSELGYTVVPDTITGTWNLDVMLGSSLHIEEDLNTILERHGYQSESRGAGNNYIGIGVNWGYSGAQLVQNIDPLMVIAILALLLLIIFTGYLIIYNVFQISVSNDIRFYGLLKTIGTTGRQLKHIIRQQALLLSLIGIPLGLILGWLVGAQLTPVILTRLNGVSSDVVSANPLIFVGAAVFAVITVLLSCSRPGRMAARVSPVEAVRYTEGGGKKLQRRGERGGTLTAMAWANLGRNRSKSLVTILSLSLAVVLMTMTVTFTTGFDMDKYLAANSVSDFILANAHYFQTSNPGFSADTALPQAVMDEIRAQGGVAEGGVVYGKTFAAEEFITDDYYRKLYGAWLSPEELDNNLRNTPRNEDGLVIDRVQLYGMDDYTMDKLTTWEGDLSKVKEPGSRYIAAVYMGDDYDNLNPDAHWAKLGDKVTIRYVDVYEYVNSETGEVYDSPEDVPAGEGYWARPVKYQDVEYEVAALVNIPSSLTYRYYGADEFILNDQTFIQDSGTDHVMLYAFDTEDEAANAAMESFLADYTQNVNSQFDYESKATYQAEFESFRSMFLILGGVLSGIIGLVGILNFINAVLTGILTRKREFAVLQSIGMTGRQLKTMLVMEGLFYTLLSLAFSLILTLALGPILGGSLGNIFWFFTYRLTVTPLLAVLPVFLILGCLVPLGVYRSVSRLTIVERLRQAEN